MIELVNINVSDDTDLAKGNIWRATLLAELVSMAYSDEPDDAGLFRVMMKFENSSPKIARFETLEKATAFYTDLKALLLAGNDGSIDIKAYE